MAFRREALLARSADSTRSTCAPATTSTSAGGCRRSGRGSASRRPRWSGIIIGRRSRPTGVSRSATARARPGSRRTIPRSSCTGPMVWHGRIYSPLPFVRSLSRQRVNSGIWGTASFPVGLLDRRASVAAAAAFAGVAGAVSPLLIWARRRRVDDAVHRRVGVAGARRACSAGRRPSRRCRCSAGARTCAAWPPPTARRQPSRAPAADRLAAFPPAAGALQRTTARPMWSPPPVIEPERDDAADLEGASAGAADMPRRRCGCSSAGRRRSASGASRGRRATRCSPRRPACCGPRGPPAMSTSTTAGTRTATSASPSGAGAGSTCAP